MARYFKKGKLFQHDIDILKNISENSNKNTTNDEEAVSNNEKSSKKKKNVRIYLNDHLTEKGGKLSRLCRKLREKKVIEKFRILNSDLPRVKIHFKDTSEKIFEYEECFLFFGDTNNQQEAETNLLQDSPAEDDPINEENNAVNDTASDVNFS